MVEVVEDKVEVVVVIRVVVEGAVEVVVAVVGEDGRRSRKARCGVGRTARATSLRTAPCLFRKRRYERKKQ